MSPSLIPVPRIAAASDATLDVRIVRSIQLLYAQGPDASVDRPAHVRAGSGLAWVGNKLAVVQDDANFVALVDVDTGLAGCIQLPAGHDHQRQFDEARGNKAFKNDFESLVSIARETGTTLLAFGSGSTARRESIAIIDDAEAAMPRVRVVRADALYAALRHCTDFSGSELNVEGAVILGDTLRLFNRGNGAAHDTLAAVNATCDLELPALLAHLAQPLKHLAPPPQNVLQYELGALDGTRLSFTDATALESAGPSAYMFAASAEASPDAVRDGEVVGSAIGIHEYASGVHTVRWGIVRTALGHPSRVKVEGIATGLQPGQFYAVVDSDDHARPCDLLELRISSR